MELKQLLYKLTGTEEPRFLTKRERAIVDKCLTIINELESTQQQYSPNGINTNNDHEFNMHQHWRNEPGVDDYDGGMKHFQD